jgi:hypothetical protein
VLLEIGAVDDPMIPATSAWIAAVAGPDAGVPFVMPTAAIHPHAPWMVPSDGGSFLTSAIRGRDPGRPSGDPDPRQGYEINGIYEPVPDAAPRFVAAAAERGVAVRLLQPGETIEVAAAARGV